MLIEAKAPVRVADCGGWTDTWFAGTGLVCSVAVEPGAWATIAPAPAGSTEMVVNGRSVPPEEHPLLWATLDHFGPVAPARIEVGAGVPPGCGTGTSASVVVALLSALSAWRDMPHPEPPDPGTIAAEAHAVEVGLGWQSGIQDQQAAAWGGISLIEMAEYPHAIRRQVPVSQETRQTLDHLLVTVYLGRPHRSSGVHEQVIAQLDTRTPSPLLRPLREAAAAAAQALTDGDLVAYGQALSANTDAQKRLHCDLVGPDAQAIIELARRHEALGWKVNGAGGDGGTVTVLLAGDRSGFAHALAATPWSILDLHLARRGVTVEIS